MNQYFYINSLQNQCGPHPVDQLKEHNLSPETPVWRSGLVDWVEAKDVDELRFLFDSSTPPPFPSTFVVEELKPAPTESIVESEPEPEPVVHSMETDEKSEKETIVVSSPEDSESNNELEEEPVLVDPAPVLSEVAEPEIKEVEESKEQNVIEESPRPIEENPRPIVEDVNKKSSLLANGDDRDKDYLRSMPKTWFLESILLMLCCCTPFAILGFFTADKVEALYEAGNFEGAKKASERAKKWTLWGLGVGLLLYALLFLFVIFVKMRN